MSYREFVILVPVGVTIKTGNNFIVLFHYSSWISMVPLLFQFLYIAFKFLQTCTSTSNKVKGSSLVLHSYTHRLI